MLPPPWSRKELEVSGEKAKRENLAIKSSNAQLQKDVDSAQQAAATGRKVVEAATAAKKAAEESAEASKKDKEAAVGKAKESERLRIELQKEKELAQHRLEATRQEVDAGKKSLAKEQETVKSTAAARDQALAKCARLESEISSMTEQKMNVDGANVKLRSNLKEAEAALAKAKNECKKLSEQLSQEEQDVVMLNVQVHVHACPSSLAALIDATSRCARARVLPS